MGHNLDSRRQFLKATLPASLLSTAAAAGLLQPTAAYAWFWGPNAQPGYNPYAPAPAAPSAAPAVASHSRNTPARPKTPLEKLVDELRHAQPETNAAVDFLSPEVAIDGASITLDIQVLLPDVDGIAVYLEGNPRPLAAVFHLAPEMLPEMKLMVRLAQSSNVTLVVRSQGRFYRNSKFIKVTQGGCSDTFEVTDPQRKGWQKRNRSAY